MSFEAITSIAAIEAEAKATVANAQAKAKQMLADAELAGKAAIEAAQTKAGSELAELRLKTDEKTATDTQKLAEGQDSQAAALRVKAEKRLDAAAALIVERIVNS